MRKRMYGKLTALALAGAMVLSGCGQSGGNSGTSTADSKAETSASSGAETSSEKKPESIGRTDIISANSSDIRSMDPQVGVDSPSATLNFHIYNGLIKIDDNREPVGDLAESFEIVDDTKYKFKLRKGVKFHNGDELKASDVKFSLERAKEMPRVKQYVEQIDSITVEDDHNLTLHLAEPYAPLLAALSHTGTSIVPEAAVTAQGDAFWENPIGTGPMQFVEWVPNDHYSLKRFDDYFKGPGKTTSLTLRIMPEGGARTIALETGEIDMSISVDATDVQNVKANKELMALEKTSVSVEYLAMNCEKERSQGAPGHQLRFKPAGDHRRGPGGQRPGGQQRHERQYPGLQRGDHRLFPGSGEGQGPDGRGRLSGRF